ncbi:hypothetical protein ACXYUI_32820, partial [Klebsiella pneumoniae]
SLLQFRDRFKLPLSDEQCRELAFYKPADDSPEMKHLHARRAALGGYLPRRHAGDARRTVPPLEEHSKFALEADGKEM